MYRFSMPAAGTVAATSAWLLAAVLAGCGKAPPAEPSSNPPVPVAPRTSAPAETHAALHRQPVQPAGPAAASARVDRDGRKWLGEIPYDVWFHDPLGVAGNTQGVAAAPSVSPATELLPSVAGTTTSPTTAVNTTAGPASADQTDWKSIIPAEVLDSEVTRIRNRFTQRLQSVGSYNSSYLELPPHIATLAVLAGIALEHPDPIRWKANAKYVRDLAADMGRQKLQTGAASYRTLQVPWEQIVETLDGSRPAALPEGPEETDFSAIADMGALMKRLDVASKWLKVNVGTAEALQEKADDVAHEAAVIAALGKVITTEGYGYSEDEGFLGHALPMIESARKMAEAARTKNFAAYDEGINRVYRACSECHSDYRG